MMRFLLLSILFLLGCSSDSSKPLPNIGREELWNEVVKVTSDVELVVTTHEEDKVSCLSYSEKCLNAFRLRVGLVKMILLQFTDTESAYQQAIKLNEFNYRNWVFDEVRGEPYLEKLLQKAFGAELNTVKMTK